MKKIFVFLLPVILNASTLQINKLQTDLYSKSTPNTLKKVELSLEFEGENVAQNKNKIIDSIHTIISAFFYEDLFTELGKNNFKKTLEKFIEKKYKLKIDDMYILSLNSVEKFDIEELKNFLQSVETQEENASAVPENTAKNLEIPKVQVPNIQDIQVPQIPKLFTDDEKQENDNISIENLNVPKFTPDIEEKMKKALLENEFENNASRHLQNQNLKKTEQNSSTNFQTENNASL